MDVEVAVSVAVGVAVTVGVRVRVGARSEAEDGRKKLNKHANTPAASSSASIISNVRHRAFNMSSVPYFSGSIEAKPAESPGRNVC